MDKKNVPKEQQLTLLMDQTFWEKLGTCGYRPYLNFTRVIVKALTKTREKEGTTNGTKDKTVEGTIQENSDDWWRKPGKVECRF